MLSISVALDVVTLVGFLIKEIARFVEHVKYAFR